MVLCLSGLCLLALGACSEGIPSPTTTTSPATTTTSSTVPEAIDVTSIDTEVLQPGTYYNDHDGSVTTTLRVEFTVAEPRWEPFVGTFKSGPVNPGGYVAVKYLAVTQVASAACDSTVWVPVGDTAEDLAVALAGIDDFLTREAVSPVSAYGYDGYHLVLEVPDLGNEVGHAFDACDDGYFDGYFGPTLGRYYQGPGQVVEFWALDVEGAPLLIEATWFPDSPAEDVAQLRAILDSTVILP